MHRLYESMKYIYILFLLLTINPFTFSQDNIEIDSNAYPWYSPSLNYLQFYSKNSLTNFYEALNNSKKNKVSIIHFGDSHIQSEIPTNETRILLQKKYGNGGRGIVFPYSTAKTYSSIHYSTRHTGNWSYAKSNKSSKDLPKGLMGISSKTLDSTASFTITFNSKIPTNQLKINLFCETDSLSYDIIIETDGNSTPIDVYKNNENKGFLSLSVPSISNTLTFKCLKTSNTQKQFIIHGFEIVNIENKGVIYYSSGVGGAKFNSILNIENFNKELKIISPDLIIMDFGTNDFLYSDTIKESLQSDIKNVIASIRKSSPLASIVLCSTQDLFYKQKNLNATIAYVELIKKIAKETETAYWDWFNISGGKGALKIWLNQGLAKTDLIHLSNNGYRIKGKLLFEAIENTKNKIELTPTQNEFILTQQPKKIDPSIEVKNQDKIITLSNREIIQADKTPIDSINTALNFQNELLKNDSINKSTKISTTGNTEILKIENKTDKTIITPNQEIKDSTLSNINSKPNLTYSNVIDSTKSNLNEKKINTSTSFNSDFTKNQTYTVLENSVPAVPISEPKKQDKNFQLNNKTTVNIKVEQIEDFNDSTITMVETNNILKDKNSTQLNRKNYQIARERQHQLLDHDTLAVKIIKDSTTITTTKKPIKKTIKPKNVYYKVRNGDNLSFIAEKHNVSVNDIKTWNRLKNDNLSIGQTIIIKR